jgi:DNA-nicking Smr family endonuclease
VKAKKTKQRIRSLKELKHALQGHLLPEAPPAQGAANDDGRTVNEPVLSEQRLFQSAMADVKPLAGREALCVPAQTPRRLPAAVDPDENCLLRLQKLVKKGEGFRVADTAEYIEGKGPNVHPLVLRRLHRGDFAIQAHLDLHGLSLAEAEKAFDTFMRDCRLNAKRAVLIIHGRGRSSPQKPVLKHHLQQWLTRSPWRKWIIAFASARPCDGGAGATYVLLRRKPLTKRWRKKIFPPPGP